MDTKQQPTHHKTVGIPPTDDSEARGDANGSIMPVAHKRHELEIWNREPGGIVPVKRAVYVFVLALGVSFGGKVCVKSPLGFQQFFRYE